MFAGVLGDFGAAGFANRSGVAAVAFMVFGDGGVEKGVGIGDAVGVGDVERWLVGGAGSGGRGFASGFGGGGGIHLF